MNTLYEEGYPLKLISHRGAKTLAPENTMPAFERALELSPDGIEFDVLLTKDLIPVVTHNDSLSVLTDNKGYVHSTPYDKISEIDFGSHFDKKFQGTRIPKLSEVLDLLYRYDAEIIVEIKSQRELSKIACEKIGNMLSDYNFRGELKISSSNINILSYFMEHFPKYKRALILYHPAFSFLISHASARMKLAGALHPSLHILNSRLVDKAKERSWPVYAWTANSEADFRKCIKLGVDGAFTDNIEQARNHIEKIMGE